MPGEEARAGVVPSIPEGAHITGSQRPVLSSPAGLDYVKGEDGAKCTHPRVNLRKVRQFHAVKGCPMHKVAFLEKLRPVKQSSNRARWRDASEEEGRREGQGATPFRNLRLEFGQERCIPQVVS